MGIGTNNSKSIEINGTPERRQTFHAKNELHRSLTFEKNTGKVE